MITTTCIIITIMINYVEGIRTLLFPKNDKGTNAHNIVIIIFTVGNAFVMTNLPKNDTSVAQKDCRGRK